MATRIVTAARSILVRQEKAQETEMSDFSKREVAPQKAVKGYWEGAVHALGVSTLNRGTSLIFRRYDYPALLKEAERALGEATGSDILGDFLKSIAKMLFDAIYDFYDKNRDGQVLTDCILEQRSLWQNIMTVSLLRALSHLALVVKDHNKRKYGTVSSGEILTYLCKALKVQFSPVHDLESEELPHHFYGIVNTWVVILGLHRSEAVPVPSILHSKILEALQIRLPPICMQLYQDIAKPELGLDLQRRFFNEKLSSKKADLLFRSHRFLAAALRRAARKALLANKDVIADKVHKWIFKGEFSDEHERWLEQCIDDFAHLQGTFWEFFEELIEAKTLKNVSRFLEAGKINGEHPLQVALKQLIINLRDSRDPQNSFIAFSSQVLHVFFPDGEEGLPIPRSFRKRVFCKLETSIVPKQLTMIYMDALAWSEQAKKVRPILEMRLGSDLADQAALTIASFMKRFVPYYLHQNSSYFARELFSLLICIDDDTQLGKEIRRDVEGYRKPAIDGIERVLASFYINDYCEVEAIGDVLKVFYYAALLRFFDSLTKRFEAVKSSDDLLVLFERVVEKMALHIRQISSIKKDVGADSLSAIDPRTMEEKYSDKINEEMASKKLAEEFLEFVDLKSADDFPFLKDVVKELWPLVEDKALPIAIRQLIESACEPHALESLALYILEPLYEALQNYEALPGCTSANPNKEHTFDAACGQMVLQILQILPDSATKLLALFPSVQDAAAENLGFSIRNLVQGWTLNTLLTTYLQERQPVLSEDLSMQKLNKALAFPKTEEENLQFKMRRDKRRCQNKERLLALTTEIIAFKIRIVLLQLLDEAIPFKKLKALLHRLLQALLDVGLFIFKNIYLHTQSKKILKDFALSIHKELVYRILEVFFCFFKKKSAIIGN